MLELKTKADLQRLVDEKLPESLTLDYKASPALSKEDKKRDEMCKDVSALANSAGGQIVYGIEEKNQKPTRVDEGAAPEITREWIEQVLNSRIQPRIQGMVITPIEVEPARYAYVITVPAATALAPHQAPDNKYYRRFNFQSVAMADYEVRDIMRRATSPDIFLKFTFLISQTTTMELRRNTEGLMPLTVHVSAVNLSVSPAEFGYIYLNVDCDLPFENKGFERVPRASEYQAEYYVYRRRFPTAGQLPLFMETEADICNFDITPPWGGHVGSVKFYFGYRVEFPGCRRFEEGHVAIKGNIAHLSMPPLPIPYTSTPDPF